MLIDARQLQNDHVLAADLCVIGAGPAGIAIAREFLGSTTTVCLVESGGFSSDRSTQHLYSGDNVGRVYFPLDACRVRHFGGSANRWGGWSRPLDPIDYERRVWVPNSGWPFGSDEVDPYIRRAETFWQLKSPAYDGATWAARAGYGPLPMGDPDFTDQVFQFSPLVAPVLVGQTYREELVGAPNVTVVINANAVELDIDPEGDRITGIRLRTLQGKDTQDLRVEAQTYVLATGGIENPRLLLASNRVRSQGIGNDHDLVGRFFMEHPHVATGYFLPSSPSYDNRFYEKRPAAGSIIKGVLVASEALAAREGMLGISVSPEPPGYSVGDLFNSWPRQWVLALTRLERLTQTTGAWTLVRRLKGSMYWLTRANRDNRFARRMQGALGVIDQVDFDQLSRPPLRDSRFRLYCRSEQAPDPESRVILGPERDGLGMPRVQLRWRLNELDLSSIKRGVARLATAFGKSGMGRVMMPDGWEDESWAERIVGGPHHMGTTRMAEDPSRGVVDRNGRVHGVANLYLAGSSVFPTAGYANPTLTLTALAIRLADHLKPRAA